MRNTQKARVQSTIKNWYIKECAKAIQNDEVIPEWKAIWKGMRAECANATGLAFSTIDRYWNGVIGGGNNEIFTFAEVAFYGRI